MQGKNLGGSWHAHLIPSGASGSFRQYDAPGAPILSLYRCNGHMQGLNLGAFRSAANSLVHAVAMLCGLAYSYTFLKNIKCDFNQS